MLIEIDGYFKQAWLQTTAAYTVAELRALYDDFQENKGSLSLELDVWLCREHGMSMLKNPSGNADIIIDTDTDRIYKPKW
ncbi:hypothetical protein B5M42_018180 [Paenibacillus athensensis]|uniref:Uncharacterized protein n=1 Tax=Paenibacillus athensensis TaxID=1967502 RepID=A0A4Y8Q1F4_9BACL|nr:hypothetical protein [Paenibacillus athensensis]MCD1260733.1 hypothetical protein [Paenibacillus athensensis]